MFEVISGVTADITSIPVPGPPPQIEEGKEFVNTNLYLILVSLVAAVGLAKMWKNATLRTLMIILMVGALTWWLATSF